MISMKSTVRPFSISGKHRIALAPWLGTVAIMTETTQADHDNQGPGGIPG
jgi:hypothetical protein